MLGSLCSTCQTQIQVEPCVFLSLSETWAPFADTWSLGMSVAEVRGRQGRHREAEVWVSQGQVFPAVTLGPRVPTSKTLVITRT